MKARMTNTTVMAVRGNFLISVFTSTSKQSRYQIKQAAIERGVEQRRMPDKVVDTCWHKYPAHQPENRQDKSNSKNIGGKDSPNTTITGNRLMLTLVVKRDQALLFSASVAS
jgi:hypothetical protein